MEPIQIIMIVFGAFALSRVFLRAKEKKLTKNQFLFWSILWTSLIVFSFIPGILTSFANLTGIGRGIDILVYLGIMLLFYFLFKLYIKIRGIEEKVTKLVREIAIKNESKTRKKNR